MTLAEKIVALRGEQKLSQGDLAEQLDVSRQSVSKWETGQAVPELEKIIKLADLFGVSVDELVREEKTPRPDASQAAAARPQIVYVEQKGLTALQKTGVVVLVSGALMLFGIQFNVYFPVFGVPVIILSLPLIFAAKHPWLTDGWLLCLGSCLILNPHISAAPWGLVGGLRFLHAYLTVPATHYSAILFAAVTGIAGGFCSWPWPFIPAGSAGAGGKAGRSLRRRQFPDKYKESTPMGCSRSFGPLGPVRLARFHLFDGFLKKPLQNGGKCG